MGRIAQRAEMWLLVLLMVCGIGQIRVEAGAWSQPRGHFYTKLSGIFYGSDEIFNDMGKRAPLGMDENRFDAGQGFLYLEYGLRERLTLIAKLSAGELVSEDSQVEQITTGIGDLELGGKYQLVDGPVVLAPFAIVKIPTGYNEEYDPAMGTGDADLEFRLLTARSLYPWPFYLGAETGYRFRGGPYSNQIPYFFEAGATPHKKVFAKAYLEGKNTITGNEEVTGVVGVLQVSEGNFTKVGFNAAFNLRGGVWADILWEKVVSGKNIGAGSSWGLGLAYSY